MGLAHESVSPRPETERPNSGRPFATVVPLLGSAAILLLLALLGYAMARREGFAGFGINAVGEQVAVRARPAPDLALPLFNGLTFRLSEQRGRVVVVNYWASWCPPCRQEAPVLERAWRKYQDQDVVFLGVDILDTEKDALAFVREFGITFPNGRDATGEIAIDYGVTGIPETFFINQEGQLVKRYKGPLSDQVLARLVEELLP